MLLGLIPTRKNYKHQQHILAITTFSLGVLCTDMPGDFGQVAYPLRMLVFSLGKLEDRIKSVVLSPGYTLESSGEVLKTMPWLKTN